MNVPAIPIRILGGGGALGRFIAYLFSGALLMLLWLTNPRCPVRNLWGMSMMGYGLKVAIAISAAVVLGLGLHTLGVGLLNRINRLLWGVFKLIKRPHLCADVGEVSRSFMRRAFSDWVEKAGLDAQTGKLIDSEFSAVAWALNLYYSTLFHELEEVYRSSAILVDLSSAISASFLLAIFLVPRNLLIWMLLLFLFSAWVAIVQLDRLVTLVGRVVVVGYMREKNQQTVHL